MKAGAALVIAEAALLDSNVAEPDAAWSAVTTYAAAAACRQTIEGVPHRFVSKVGSNLNNNPTALDPTKWTDMGPTNRWAQYDQRLQQQTQNVASIYSKVQVTGRINIVYVGNVVGQTLRIKATDAIDGAVFDETVGLVSTSGIIDWARWARDPIQLRKDKGVALPLSGYSDLIVETWLDHPDDTAKCGELVFAYLKPWGRTKLGGRIGTKSYSRLGDDAFGTDFLNRRGRKRAGDFEVLVDNRSLDDVTDTLDEFDARPVLFVASERFATTYLFGVLLDWSELLSWRSHTALSIKLQSFTRS